MVAAALVSAAFMSKLAFSAQERTQLGALSASEGIYIDRKSFDIIKGTAKVDPTADLMKLGAKEVKNGAIVVRVREKLYLSVVECFETVCGVTDRRASAHLG